MKEKSSASYRKIITWDSRVILSKPQIAFVGGDAVGPLVGSAADPASIYNPQHTQNSIFCIWIVGYGRWSMCLSWKGKPGKISTVAWRVRIFTKSHSVCGWRLATENGMGVRGCHVHVTHSVNAMS